MQGKNYDIVIFLVIVIGLIFVMVTFIIVIAFLYNKRQREFRKNLALTMQENDKAILNAQIEIQEQTFQHISREIHDNISLSLTLAKLNLNTLCKDNSENYKLKIDSSIELLTQSISQLNDLSKSLDADIINRHSLLKAIDNELQRIKTTGFLEITNEIEGVPVYMNSQAELLVFRIIQEALNNIIKHANTKYADLRMSYGCDQLIVTIADKGTGFDKNQLLRDHSGSGLKNMESRVKLLGGDLKITSQLGCGANITFTIPFK